MLHLIRLATVGGSWLRIPRFNTLERCSLKVRTSSTWAANPPAQEARSTTTERTEYPPMKKFNALFRLSAR
jgi:hypothetical protein